MPLRIFRNDKKKKDREPVKPERENPVLTELDSVTADAGDGHASARKTSSTASDTSGEDPRDVKANSSIDDSSVGDLLTSMMEDADVTDAVSSLIDGDFDGLQEVMAELGLDPGTLSTMGEGMSDSPVSALIEDDTILSLLHSRVINMSQVFEALRSNNDSSDLWRQIAEMESVDCDRVYEVVAGLNEIESFDYLDALPTREFIEELTVRHSSEVVVEMLERAVLPVDLQLDKKGKESGLIAVSFDPLNASVRACSEQTGRNIICKYVSKTDFEERASIVRDWIAGDSRFGTPGTLSETPVDNHVSQAPSDCVENDESNAAKPDAPLSLMEALKINVKTDAVIHGKDADRPPVSHTESGEDESRSLSAESNVKVNGRADGDAENVEVPSEKKSKRKKSSSSKTRDRVILSLVSSGEITEDHIREARLIYDADGGKDALWRIVADLSGVKRESVYAEAARIYAFEKVEIEAWRPDPDFVFLTMETIAEEHRDRLLELLLIPFEHTLDYETGMGKMIFVTHDPTNVEVNRVLHELDLGQFELRYASETDISGLIEELFPQKNEYLERIEENSMAFDLGTSYEESTDVVDEEALEAEISRSKLLNLFEASLVEAVRNGISDIHIFPNAKRQVDIFFRQDGRLKKWHTEDRVHPEAFLAVVKDNASNIDRFERDKAQDGFIQRKIDDTLIRFRVSILPIATANQELKAESIVIRVLDDRKVITDLHQLGMLDVALERFEKAINQPYGMIILTGPTGSGKSTTLVAALHQVVTPEVNVLTVEDPVEYIINGVRQIKLSHKLDLEAAMRSILRHDPDIVMVGEMRDRGTAELAIKLANTGHLTFSTLHTNDAPAAVSRLYKMGIEPFLIAYAINLVVAQRLIRNVCGDCREVDESPNRVLMKSLGWKEKDIDGMTVYKATRGAKCSTCHGAGYKGRRAICETLYFTDEIQQMIVESGESIDEDSIRRLATKQGMLSLRDSARLLVEQGETTVEEMLRVTGA